MHVQGGNPHHQQQPHGKRRKKKDRDCCLLDALGDQCYVSTAAHGEGSPELDTLRRYRDEVLRPRLSGRLFIRAYYTLGPYPAWLVRRSPRFARVTRWALQPVVDHATQRVRRRI